MSGNNCFIPELDSGSIPYAREALYFEIKPSADAHLSKWTLNQVQGKGAI